MGIKLKLNGKPLDLNPPSMAEVKIIAFLDKSAADDLYDTVELAQKVGIREAGVKDHGAREVFQNYSLRVGKHRYWGNPKAIKALREQVGQ